MTRDDIIRMAREACGGKPPDGWGVMFDHDQLERFVALVEAHIRKKIARWQIGSGYSTGHGDTIEDLLVELEWQVRESEREACAKVCVAKAHEWREEDMHTWPDGRRTSMGDSWYQHRAEGAIECAEIIRARGQE